nr:MAG TPA: hypothetical protein [Caudoviricetes sp.]
MLSQYPPFLKVEKKSTKTIDNVENKLYNTNIRGRKKIYQTYDIRCLL